ncbi:MAG TPA: FtsQ-type POTRA domain-containing protein [Candidatus Polarisedimenticolia bacterium]|nr:FtsQ-type POTRA domain-containing protein [Candidatus Polarisedimenticolia bacterium]
MRLRRSPARAAWRGQADELRYLRRDGNRRVRARRRRRTALRMSLLTLVWIGAGIGAAVAAGLGYRWAVSPARFRLEQVLVRGAREARDEEIRELAGRWMGRNILTVDLGAVESKVREHPWVGSGGWVRIQRKLPSTLIVSLRERVAAGTALVDGALWLLDEAGLPIAAFGPRYAGYDFPILKGVDALVAETGRPMPGREAPLREALRMGIDVSRTLAARAPAFHRRVSEIDLSKPGMVVVRQEGESYDLRLSRDDVMRNLDNYFALKDEIAESGGEAIEYVDLRWRDRIAVLPAAEVLAEGGGK